MELLKLRNQMKSKKPAFKRHQANVKKQLGVKWIKPRGLHNKDRNCLRGRGSLPAVGFRSPKDVRGLNKEGFRTVVVFNVDQLKSLNAKEEVALLASSLGMKKKVEILKKAGELGIKISNMKDGAKFIDDAKKIIDERKKKMIFRKDKNEKAKQEAEKKKQEEKDKKNEKKDEKKDESKNVDDKKVEIKKDEKTVENKNLDNKNEIKKEIPINKTQEKKI